jgi:D-amino-acid dehydrogenase
MRIVVIGAGAVGNATAFYLRKHGHDVVVIERQPGAALETSLGRTASHSMSMASTMWRPTARVT